METKEAYNAWSEIYDTNQNRTRDLESVAIRAILKDLKFSTALELGCGTGKNTSWLAQKAEKVIATDFSTEMLRKAREKITAGSVNFVHADVRKNWNFGIETVDLITCSLILEHIENLDFIFQQANQILRTGGHFYVGELHPFKQYLGTKARFETSEGLQELECFVHHISDFIQTAMKNGFQCASFSEWFDEPRTAESIPRLAVFLFQKS